MVTSNTEKRSSLSKLRQREAALDTRASLLDTHTDLKFSETLEIAARGMFFTRHFLGRFLGKNLLMFFALSIPVTIMPWPIKIVIDHVVLGTPIEQATGYPPVWRPFLDMLAGYTPLEVLLAVTVVFFILIVLIGAYAQGDNARDETEGNLERGPRHRDPGRRAPLRPAPSKRVWTTCWRYRVSVATARRRSVSATIRASPSSAIAASSGWA